MLIHMMFECAVCIWNVQNIQTGGGAEIVANLSFMCAHIYCTFSGPNIELVVSCAPVRRIQADSTYSAKDYEVNGYHYNVIAVV